MNDPENKPDQFSSFARTLSFFIVEENGNELVYIFQFGTQNKQFESSIAMTDNDCACG